MNAVPCAGVQLRLDQMTGHTLWSRGLQQRWHILHIYVNGLEQSILPQGGVSRFMPPVTPYRTRTLTG